MLACQPVFREWFSSGAVPASMGQWEYVWVFGDFTMIIGYFYVFVIFNTKESRMLHPLLQCAVELANEKVSCSFAFPCI